MILKVTCGHRGQVLKNTTKQINKIEAVPVHSYGVLTEVQIPFLILKISSHFYLQNKAVSQLAQQVKVLIIKTGGRVQLIPSIFMVLGDNGCLYIVL